MIKGILRGRRKREREREKGINDNVKDTAGIPVC